MNNNSNHSITVEINRLCDVFCNPKRPSKDHFALLNLLRESPKDCVPFKGKILQHVILNSKGHHRANLRTLSSIFARATILFRGSENKSDGPLGAWKLGLSNELTGLEENITRLYESLGIKCPTIITKVVDTDTGNNSNDDGNLSASKLSSINPDCKNVIKDYVHHANVHANNVCALINLVSNFDLPIPPMIILRLASKIGSLRCNNLKKLPKNSLKSLVYSQTPTLIEISLLLTSSLSDVLETDLIPFIPMINQNLMRILDWTRTSGFEEHDKLNYHSIRSRVIQTICDILERYHINCNLTPDSLKNLIENELLFDLSKLETWDKRELSQMTLGDKISRDICEKQNEHIMVSLNCLENVILIYSGYLDCNLESKIKRFIIEVCLDIYRNFSLLTITNGGGQLQEHVKLDDKVFSDTGNDINGGRRFRCNLECRRKLIQLLETIMSEPYSTSASEIGTHVLELAFNLESDREVKHMIHRALKVGLAHRPIIISYDDIITRDCLFDDNGEDTLLQQQQTNRLDSGLESPSYVMAVEDTPQTTPPPPQPEPTQEPTTVAEEDSQEVIILDSTNDVPPLISKSTSIPDQQSILESTTTTIQQKTTIQQTPTKSTTTATTTRTTLNGDEGDAFDCMRYFVEKFI